MVWSLVKDEKVYDIVCRGKNPMFPQYKVFLERHNEAPIHIGNVLYEGRKRGWRTFHTDRNWVAKARGFISRYCAIEHILRKTNLWPDE